MAAVKFEHSSITYNGFDKIETGSIFFFTNGVDSLLNEFPYFAHISEQQVSYIIDASPRLKINPIDLVAA